MDPILQLIDDIKELELLHEKLVKAKDESNAKSTKELIDEIKIFKSLIDDNRILYQKLTLEREKNDAALEQLRTAVRLESDPIELDLDMRMELMNKNFAKKWRY